jgi:TonB family protein
MEVLSDGRVGFTSVRKPSGCERLDHFVLEWISNWAFHPATSRGVPVRAVVDQPFRFE